MKKKKRMLKKVIISFIAIFTFVSCFYTVSLMNNDNVVKAMEQEREDISMIAEAYKWIDPEDIDPKTGKLKEGVIYNIGENGRAYTSEGFKQFEFIDTNREITPLVEYKTGGEIAYINYVQNRNEILFSNNFMVDFDITYDEKNINIEKKKYELVKTEYKQSSYQDKRTHLVMKSKRVKVGWFYVTVWYPAIESYYETIIVNTPHNTYNEVVQHVGSISLEDNANVLTKLTANAVDKYFPSVRSLSNEHKIPLLISFMDVVIGKVVYVIRQVLSMIADFVPILDEIKTAFETIKGYDLFTGEEIGTFWRIFGAVTLAVTLVVSFVSFGAGGVAIDAGADAAQFAKKASKLANKIDDVNAATKQLDNVYDGVKKVDGLKELGGDALKYASKHLDDAKKVDNAAELAQEGIKSTSKAFSKFPEDIKTANLSSSVFTDNNAFKRGFIIDEFAGNVKNAENAGDVIGLGRTAKTFDLLDTTSDSLVSVKSLDTTAKTYQTPANLKRTLTKYIDDIDPKKWSKGYDGATNFSETLKYGKDFKNTRLDLYIPKEGFSKAQLEVINDIAKNLPDGVALNIIKLK